MRIIIGRDWLGYYRTIALHNRRVLACCLFCGCHYNLRRHHLLSIIHSLQHHLVLGSSVLPVAVVVAVVIAPSPSLALALALALSPSLALALALALTDILILVLVCRIKFSEFGSKSRPSVFDTTIQNRNVCYSRLKEILLSCFNRHK